MLQLPDLRISDNSYFALIAAACFGVGLIVRSYLTKSGSSLPLPPSPLTSRLRGHSLPLRNPFLTVAEWVDEYGPLITIRRGTEKIVIIGRHKAAVDIMEMQGGSVADRPRMVAAGEILSGGHNLVFTPVGDRLRQMRRALHTHLQPKVAGEYQPLQMSHAKQMILNIDDPSNFRNHTITLFEVAYGKNTPTVVTDLEVIEIRQIMDMLRTVWRSATYLVESIPWLKYLPWYGQELRHGYEIAKRLHTSQLNRVKQQMQSNADIGHSFAKHVLENGHLYALTEIKMAFLASALFGGGSDTVSLAICTVMMAAACFPEEQAKVQAELDEVIGMHRAPTFADQESLPRLQAFISEALRWRPLAPSGGHLHRNNILEENYCIPAGTTVYDNHWAISRDPEVFPDPHQFKPQRWINNQGRLRGDLKFFVYGFGQRVCPGKHVANRSVFITSLLILWAFQLTQDPTEPLDDMGFMNGSLGRPCSIEFKMRVPEPELKCMMENYSEVS
ncbi:cytochrome P450 [Rhizopogon vinicolor AM-OR11-026]|uniref:Cytochrome P450 n=1 Tax=Rhizopogon vinicolor AM-OR11-026 TaxID=1314800 RepID=A0A1B7MX09_9AGAM|nr:cytochrome P450 [Rhizopogon vinicolor AM-OR11-026]